MLILKNLNNQNKVKVTYVVICDMVIDQRVIGQDFLQCYHILLGSEELEVSLEIRKEMFHLTMHSTHLWLSVRHMAIFWVMLANNFKVTV